ncbi:hypothetical protein REPUB_Repub08aG0203100 [Reevesia pubescens]
MILTDYQLWFTWILVAIIFLVIFHQVLEDYQSCKPYISTKTSSMGRFQKELVTCPILSIWAWLIMHLSPLRYLKSLVRCGS